MKSRVFKTLSLVTIVFLALAAMVFMIFNCQINTSKASAEELESVYSENYSENTETDQVTPYAFGRLQTEYNVNGARVSVDLDARDGIFGDDILISFKELTGKTVTFAITVTFKANTGDGNEGWIKTAISGNRLMNSGKTSVHTIICDMTITYNGVSEVFSYTFNKY